MANKQGINQSMNSIGDIGIEYEFSNVDRNTRECIELCNNLLPGWQLTHDASSETPVLMVGDFPLKFENEKEMKNFVKDNNSVRMTVVGGEVVSPILTEDVIERNVYKLVEFLYRINEVLHERGSLHVHVNVSNSVPLHALKKLIQIAVAYESIFYRLGGLGRMNRGERNNFIYQRPYLGNGPIVVRVNGNNHPILSVDDLLKSETKKQFFDRYGDSVHNWNVGNKYVTQRYMGLNFYSILRYGSVEFRYANTCQNPLLIMGWINFCRNLVFRAFESIDDDTLQVARPLHKSDEVSVFELQKIFRYAGLTDSEADAMFESFRNTPVPKFNNLHSYSHLGNPTSLNPSAENNYYITPKLDDGVNVLIPDIEDVHNLENKMRGVMAEMENNRMRQARNQVEEVPDIRRLKFMVDEARAVPPEVEFDEDMELDEDNLFGDEHDYDLDVLTKEEVSRTRNIYAINNFREIINNLKENRLVEVRQFIGTVGVYTILRTNMRLYFSRIVPIQDTGIMNIYYTDQDMTDFSSDINVFTQDVLRDGDMIDLNDSFFQSIRF